MKIISSEFVHNYQTYSFGYANYCIKEKGDSLFKIYELGFLPYSGSKGVKDTFYMARSSRIPLNNFNLSSENRRIAKKFDGTLKRESHKIKDFDINDRKFLDFCLDYFKKRHGPQIMPEERLRTILNSGLVTDIASYHKDEKIVAYVFEVSDKDITHFWFSFYDTNLVFQSLGLWLMLDSLREAKKRKAKHFYTGTVYGEKALYKDAFQGIEYWDGSSWMNDIKTLKNLARTDNNRLVGLSDAMKEDFNSF